VSVLNPAPKGSKTGQNIYGQKGGHGLQGSSLVAIEQHGSVIAPLIPAAREPEFAHYPYLEVSLS
jgi:hypothetical protein